MTNESSARLRTVAACKRARNAARLRARCMVAVAMTERMVHESHAIIKAMYSRRTTVYRPDRYR